MAQQFDEIPCPKCRNTIKVKALLCPHCGAEFSRTEADTRAKKHYKDMGGGCLILAALVALVGWGISSCSGDDDAEVTKAETVAKPVKWNEVAILKNLEVCRGADKAIQQVLDKLGPREAYGAASRARQECSRAMTEAPDGPDGCFKAAMMGMGYYDTVATAMDTLDSRPSTVERVKAGQQVFAQALDECDAALGRKSK